MIDPFWDRLRTPVAVPREVDPADNPFLRAEAMEEQRRIGAMVETYEARYADLFYQGRSAPYEYDELDEKVNRQDTIDSSTYAQTRAPRPDKADYEDDEVLVYYDVVGTDTPDSLGRFRYLTADQVFTASAAQAAQDQVNAVWEAVLDMSGLDELSAEYGIEDNWWPGLELRRTIVDPTKMTFGSAAAEQILRDAYIEPWAVGQDITVYDKQTQESFSRWIRYDTSKSTQSFAAMGSNDRAMYSSMMVSAGLLPEGYEDIGEFTAEGASAFTEATRWANYYGTSVKDFLENQSGLMDKINKGRGGGAGGGRRYAIEVPDYDTITQMVKDMMRQKLRRDPKGWELSLVADEMQRQYGSWADAQKRKAVGGNGVYEVPDPQQLTESFIESKYEDEIDRIEDVGEQAQNNQLLVRAATAGAALNQGTNRRLPA